MKPALLLLDLQQDFLDRPGLYPDCTRLTAAASSALALARAAGWPILHVHTVVAADGSDAMPHWRQLPQLPCRIGTRGVQAPPALRPAAGEPVFAKQTFNAFDDAQLGQCLQQLGVDTLLISGVYLHACVQATALAAYARGLDVVIVADAVGSTEPLHAALCQRWMAARCARFLSVAELHARRTPTGTAPAGIVDDRPAAVLEPLLAAAHAAASRDPGRQSPLPALLAWREQIASAAPALIACMATTIGKPVSDGHEEVARALVLLDTVLRLATSAAPAWPGVAVRYRPLGVVALLTPWNNPVAIPVAKIAAALAFGNAVIWKPSPLCRQVTAMLAATASAAGLQSPWLTTVDGDALLAERLVGDPRIAAVSLTGSIATGRRVAALCAADNKPLQAELGGNNAIVIDRHAEVDKLAGGLARAAFSFAGQRCTAIRRIIAVAAVADRLEQALASAINALPLGDPQDSRTVVGPLISVHHRDGIADAVALALAGGARRICGGGPPAGQGPGAWYAPTLLADLPDDADLLATESFGPVAVLQRAQDLEHAIALCNSVPQGLVAALAGSDAPGRRLFADTAQAGILRFDNGPLTLHPEAPFGGWKASQIGPPEHGYWDREFFARPQAVYGDPDA